jgi:hypothetical protein
LGASSIKCNGDLFLELLGNWIFDEPTVEFDL